ncbi:hypothetical protein IFM89_030239 [Coptis chinensis]|uniref:Uncharacterized protein n=1 Tax=Coptis chinensis TaxID=261450 RepID=A0A835M164_9MAGN|nr:hypothetical protein IFM89_030239 [Coptis chinensis]
MAGTVGRKRKREKDDSLLLLDEKRRFILPDGEDGIRLPLPIKSARKMYLTTRTIMRNKKAKIKRRTAASQIAKMLRPGNRYFGQRVGGLL